MFSDTPEDTISSSDNSSHQDADKHFPQLYFNQKSLNFESEMKFLNLKFKSIGENLRMSRDKSLKLSKGLQNETISHKFSIDNILGQLKSDEIEGSETADKEENGAEYELKENNIKFSTNHENGEFLWINSLRIGFQVYFCCEKFNSYGTNSSKKNFTRNSKIMVS